MSEEEKDMIRKIIMVSLCCILTNLGINDETMEFVSSNDTIHLLTPKKEVFIIEFQRKWVSEVDFLHSGNGGVLAVVVGFMGGGGAVGLNGRRISHGEGLSENQ